MLLPSPPRSSSPLLFARPKRGSSQKGVVNKNPPGSEASDASVRPRADSSCVHPRTCFDAHCNAQMCCKPKMNCNTCIARPNVLQHVLQKQTYCMKCIACVLRGPNVLQTNVLHRQMYCVIVLRRQLYCNDCPSRNRMKSRHPDNGTRGNSAAVTTAGCESADAVTQTQAKKAPPPFPWTPFWVAPRTAELCPPSLCPPWRPIK